MRLYALGVVKGALSMKPCLRSFACEQRDDEKDECSEGKRDPPKGGRCRRLIKLCAPEDRCRKLT